MVGASIYGSSASKSYGKSGRTYALAEVAIAAVVNAAPFANMSRRLVVDDDPSVDL
jgi:hypothetical protein